jgi:O-antigen/teichoic acid export membrane protein
MISLATLSMSRVKVIFSSGISRVLSAFGTAFISLVIIRLTTAELWGEALYYILILDATFVLIAWGQSPYLTQQFSLLPASIKTKWINGIVSRIPILFLSLIVLLLILSGSLSIKLIIIAYCLGRFAVQSYEPLILFERNFRLSIVAELIGLLIILAPFTFKLLPANIVTLLSLISISFFVKATLFSFSFRGYWRGPYSATNLTLEYFRDALPFFLLTVTAMLHQRIDLYTVAYFLEKQSMVHYQVLLNLLLLSHLGASLLLAPFAKNIFRLSEHSMKRLQNSFVKLGVVLSLVSIFIVYSTIEYAYGFKLSFLLYALGYFYIFNFYIYVVKNYHLGKNQQQSTAAWYSFIAFIINFLLSICLTPWLEIEGALLSAVIGQFVLSILYFRKIRSKTSTQNAN